MTDVLLEPDHYYDCYNCGAGFKYTIPTEVKQCPFCGSSNIRYINHYNTPYYGETPREAQPAAGVWSRKEGATKKLYCL